MDGLGERVAIALGNYLSKLEDVAMLEPCSIYFAENNEGIGDDICHVVARTSGAKRKYYYRRREYGYWTPWEQIKVEIEKWGKVVKAAGIKPQ